MPSTNRKRKRQSETAKGSHGPRKRRMEPLEESRESPVREVGSEAAQAPSAAPAVAAEKKRKLNLPRIIAKRAYARERVSELHRKVQDEKRKGMEGMDWDTLKGCQEKLGRYRSELEAYDEVIQDGMVGDELTEEVNESERILDHLKTSVSELVTLIERSGRKGQNGAGASTVGAGQSLSGHQCGVGPGVGQRLYPRLPKWQIGPYDGNPIRFQEFWEQFDCSIHSNGELSDTAKFSYLKMVLTGDALNAVEGLALTSANYHTAIDLLKERFGDRQTIVRTHFERIWQLSVASTTTPALRAFYDSMEKHIRCLQALGLKDEEFAKTFVPVILMKLPEALKLELNRKRGSTEWDLPNLRKLLKEEITARENSQATLEGQGGAQREKPPAGRKTDFPRTASTLVSNSTGFGRPAAQSGPKRKCSYCGDSTHFSDECTVYPDVETRKRCLGANCCYLCLRSGHLVRNCSYHSCVYCQGRHHQSLCGKRFGRTRREDKTAAAPGSGIAPFAKRTASEATAEKRGASSKASVQMVTMLASSQRTIMPTAVAMVESPGRPTKSISCRLILDSGSQRSYVTEDLANRLQLETFGSEPLTVGTFGTDSAKEVQLPVAAVRIRTRKGSVIDMTVNVLPTISVPIQKEKISVENFQFITGLTLAEPLKDHAENIHLDLLIGSDYYHDVVQDRRIKLDDGLYFTRSVFGWVLSGRVEAPNTSVPPSTTLLAPGAGATVTPVNSVMESFWNLECIGIKEDGQTKDDEVALGKVMDSLTFENGRYTVGFPWKEPPLDLPENFALALGQLKSLQKRLEHQPEIREKGPVLLKDLCGLLMRFRLGPIGILSDIEKAFLQIGLNMEDRDVTRFLWYDTGGDLQIYRFCRVPFGVISSPFLLAITVDQHLAADGSPVAANIRNNIYVDDVCVSVNSTDEAKGFYDSAKLIFRRASMNLREWYSNSDDFLNCISSDVRLLDDSMKLLGMSWDRVTDTLALRNVPFRPEGPLTKRKLLAFIASIFDPLGLFCPVTVRAKVAFQTLWKLKINWDAPVSDSFLREWNSTVIDFDGITELTVPRFLDVPLSPPNSNVNIEVHCFCDASTSAYAAAVYLRIIEKNRLVTRLIFAKHRLAPVKTLTIPRLELLGVLIGIRLICFITSELNLPISAKFLWSDSECVLHWISSSRLKGTFVENRLKEIRSYEDVEFRYVPTRDNPADLPTKGVDARALVDCPLWWGGPHWLSQPKESWPSKRTDLPPDKMERFEALESRKTPVVILAVTEPPDGFSSLLQKCSSLKKLLRTTAYVMRARDKFRKRYQGDLPISVDELAEARRFWDRRAQDGCYAEEKRLLSRGQSNGLIKQLNMHIDDSGLVRCRGRLAYADILDSAKNPILLPTTHQYSVLLIKDLHEKLMHGGTRHILSELRQQYWIPAARRCISSVIRKCVICRKWEGGPFRPPPSPALPKERLLEAPVFTYVGVDFLGPLWVRNEGKDAVKVWICLFTCAVTRAIHLEVAPSMSAEDFLEILRRFIARRGKPAVILSDNAKQFKLADSILHRIWSTAICDSAVQDYVAYQGIRWKFIVELAPWMGGFYERLVGLVKRALRKTVGHKLLTFRRLETIVIEIEAILNSRPLGFVHSDMDGIRVLTPTMFLGIGNRLGVPIIDFDTEDPEFRLKGDTVDFLLEKWKRGQVLVDNFWKRFRNEYLLNLREYGLTKKGKGRVSQPPYIGQPVLIKDDLPRGRWKLGVIQKVNRGSDGLVRSAVVRTKGTKVLQRPVSLLYPLEYASLEAEGDVTASRSAYGQPQTVEEVKPRRSIREAASKAKTAIAELFGRECRAPHEIEEA